MNRPGYITRCYKCYAVLSTVDSLEGSHFDSETKRWITRWFDPEWVIAEHIRRNH
jgi:ubiquitin C-terminal hydrolase